MIRRTARFVRTLGPREDGRTTCAELASATGVRHMHAPGGRVLRCEADAFQSEPTLARILARA